MNECSGTEKTHGDAPHAVQCQEGRAGCVSWDLDLVRFIICLLNIYTGTTALLFFELSSRFSR